ncbi:hypothetical protein B0H11DRAFT_2239239 [Mycena galericulata]|nr:hypothetical protein B0H11DRAFT_2239239 [Mycena galericulata]
MRAGGGTGANRLRGAIPFAPSEIPVGFLAHGWTHRARWALHRYAVDRRRGKSGSSHCALATLSSIFLLFRLSPLQDTAGIPPLSVTYAPPPRATLLLHREGWSCLNRYDRIFT